MPLKFSPISWERLRVGQEFSPAAFYRRSWWWWWWWSGRIHCASRQRAILDGEREHGGRGKGRTQTYPRRGNTILKLVRAEQISGPEISLVTRYMYTRGSKREIEREEDKVIRASTCKMEGWREGRKKKSEEKRRGRQSIRRVFSMRLERNYFISGRSIASTRSFHGKLPSTETLALPSKEEKRRYRVMVENEREREAILFRERAVPYAKDRTCAAI